MEPQPFGHGNPPRRSPPSLRSPASMEPQPFGHGNYTSHGPAPSPRKSFNGATAFRPWKPREAEPTTPPVHQLQWSHSLSAMETRRLPGQGAHPVPASMEPQPFGHGNSPSVAAKLPGKYASMEPQPFGHGNTTTSWTRGAPCTCFNGATAFRPWKLRSSRELRMRPSRLQWSHSLSAMETRMAVRTPLGS